MTTTQEAPMNNLLTCTHLFIDLQAMEPLLVKNLRVFITRNHRSAILFRITGANGGKVLFSRTYDWKDYNTPAAIRDAVNAVYQDLSAAGLINIGNTANPQL